MVSVLALTWLEHAARAFEPKVNRWVTPGDLAIALDPVHTVQTPALDLIDAALLRLVAKPNGRLIVSLPPQEGKSTRVAEMFPLWALAHDMDTRVVLASYSHALARRNGRAIRNHVVTHGDLLNMRIRDDVAAQHEWQLDGHRGGIYAVGIGGSLTGRPADLMVIDDPIKDMKEADSEVFRENVWNWWTSVGSTRLAPGAPVVLILTRWHHLDLAGKLLAADDGHLWEVLNIPAQADHRPELGQVDLLGREPDEFMVSARGRQAAEWEAIKVRSGPRVWSALYQGHPSPLQGDLFPAEWSRFDNAMHVDRADGTRWVPGNNIEMVQSWDLAFKDTKSSDYVVGQVWLRIGVDAYLLDQVRARLSFTATLAAIRAMTARWPQSSAKFVEDKANGPAVINALNKQIPGIIPIEPEGSKYARAAAVSPFVHSNNVHLPSAELLPNVEELLEEARAFPNGTHDDTIDALSQALNRLLLMPILSEDIFDDSDDIADALGYAGGY